MSSMDEKLDVLIASVAKLRELHEQSQLELDEKLKEDIAATQMDMMDVVIKKAQKDCTYKL